MVREDLIHLKGATPSVLVSFPKSGQTLFLALAEAWTSRPSMNTKGVRTSILAASAEAGFPPKIRATNPSPWVRVGHNPNLFTKDYLSNSVNFIELVRHPVEVILSYYAACQKISHEEVVKQCADEVPVFVVEKLKYRHNLITKTRQNHEFGKTAAVPYELLVENPLYVLEYLTNARVLSPSESGRMWVFKNHRRLMSVMMDYKSSTKLGSQTAGSFTYWRDRIGEASAKRIMDLSDFFHPTDIGVHS